MAEFFLTSIHGFSTGAELDMMSLVVAKGSTSYHLCGGLPLAGIGERFEVVVKSPHGMFAAITFVVGILGLLCPLVMLFRASL